VAPQPTRGVGSAAFEETVPGERVTAVIEILRQAT
jgi:hypothetical protein